MTLQEIQALLVDIEHELTIPARLKAILSQNQPVVIISISVSVSLDQQTPHIILYYEAHVEEADQNEQFIRFTVSALEHRCVDDLAKANKDRSITLAMPSHKQYRFESASFYQEK